MKVSLVVASGVHQGKVIPIVGAQFLVGRDPQCQLRPASQAVSKQHCAVIIRDGSVFLKDYGSTNGTLLNDSVIQNDEVQMNNNDSLKIGPLDFTVRIELSAPRPDGTPLPEVDPAITAVKAASRPVPTKNATPAPSSGSKETPALKSVSAEEAEHDRLAAMLLGLDDGEVPGGSTVVDVPVPTEAAAADAKAAEKPADKSKVPTREDTSNAASEILRKYMRRPR
jgi:pSer/pThr/pTyr-binding forkhead associated (FHA) protein